MSHGDMLHPAVGDQRQPLGTPYPPSVGADRPTRPSTPPPPPPSDAPSLYDSDAGGRRQSELDTMIIRADKALARARELRAERLNSGAPILVDRDAELRKQRRAAQQAA